MRDITDEERNYVQDRLFELMIAFKKICDAEGIWYSLAFGSALGAVRHHDFIPWDTDADVVIMLPDKEKFRKAFYKHKPEGIALIDVSKKEKCLQSHDSLIFEKQEIVNGIHLDIFQLVGAPSNKKEQNRFAKYTHYIDKIIRSKYVNIADCRPKNKWKIFLVKCILFFVPDSVLKKNIFRRETKYQFNTAKFLMSLCGYGRGCECIPKGIFESLTTTEFRGVEFNIPKNYDIYLKHLYGKDYMTPKRY